MSEQDKELEKRIETLEEFISEYNDLREKNERENRIFRIVFFYYIFPLVSTIFTVLAFKYKSTWDEMLVSGIFMLLILLLLLDSVVGKSLVKWTGFYYRFYPNEEISRNARYGFALLSILFIPSFILLEPHFSQFEEIFQIFLLIFCIMMFYGVETLIEWSTSLFLILLPKKWKKQLLGFWKKKEENKQQIITVFFVTILSCLIFGLSLWYLDFQFI